MNQIIEKHKFYQGYVCESRGASGGIVTLWLQDKWIKIAETMERNWIKTTLQNKMSSYQLIIFNVYIPNHYRDKEACWTSLSNNIEKEENSNILVGDDLNLILQANEKCGGSFNLDPFIN